MELLRQVTTDIVRLPCLFRVHNTPESHFDFFVRAIPIRKTEWLRDGLTPVFVMCKVESEVPGGETGPRTIHIDAGVV